MPLNESNQTPIATSGNVAPAVPIGAANVPLAPIPATAPVVFTPAPSTPAQLPVAHQDHPFWNALLKTLTILAAIAPPVVAIATHDPNAAAEASQLSQIAGGVFQGISAGQ